MNTNSRVILLVLNVVFAILIGWHYLRAKAILEEAKEYYTVTHIFADSAFNKQMYDFQIDVTDSFAYIYNESGYVDKVPFDSTNHYDKIFLRVNQ